jgi:transaldolase
MACTAMKAAGCSALSPALPVGNTHSSSIGHPKVLVRHAIGNKVSGVQWKGYSGSNLGHKSMAMNLRASVSTAEGTELDAISKYSEVVPDTVIFDDFERFPPTAATVSSSLLLGITSVPKGAYNSAIDSALAYNKCYVENSGERLSCFLNKALVNVGAEVVKTVPGRVSTEVDARLAYDTPGIVNEVHQLLGLYDEVEVPRDRLLFKVPATWQGIEAVRQLEAEGIQTHVSLVYSFAQASAAAQAGASVIQIFVGRVRDWARTNSGDKDVDAALASGADPGISLVTKAYNYIHKHGHKSKLMAAAVRNKQDVFSLLGLDYLVVPVKVLKSLQESKADLEDKYAFARRLSPSSAQAATFSEDELQKWDQGTFAKALGPLAEDLLQRGLDGYINNTQRVEEHFSKIWPPPNV